MFHLILVLVVLMIGYSSYSSASRHGEWSWRQFFILIGSFTAFTLVFILPLVNLSWMQKRPELLITVLLSGIFIFVATITYLHRKKPPKPNGKN